MPGDSSSNASPEPDGTPINYLALGDSYTVGEGVPASASWPMQLVQALRRQGRSWSDPLIIAQTGWTTGELLEALAEPETRDRVDSAEYQLATLLIGVNNQYRGLPIERFRSELRQLLSFATERVGDSRRVIVVSIPDWGVTVFGRESERLGVSEDIDRFNLEKQACAESFGCPWVDVTRLSREAADRAEMLAEDGLHPSAKAYSQWVAHVLRFLQA